MTSSFLWPDINHLSSEIGWVGCDRGNEHSYTQFNGFEVVVVEIVIQVQKEELVFQE